MSRAGTEIGIYTEWAGIGRQSGINDGKGFAFISQLLRPAQQRLKHERVKQ